MLFSSKYQKLKQGHSKDSWITEAEWAKMTQTPLRAESLLYVVIVLLIVSVAWASWAEIDERAMGTGKVIPSSKLQTLQSLDGGIIQEILVKEGDRINVGDVLVKVNPTRFIASFAENQQQHINLTAEVVRLDALVNDKEPVFPEELLKEFPRVVERETNLYFSSLAELASQQVTLESVIEQKKEELRESEAALRQHEGTLELAQKELASIKPLLAFGAVSDIDILRLEKEIVRSAGEAERAKANIARSTAAIREAESKKKELKLTLTNKWRNELKDAHSKLDSLTKAVEGYEDKVIQAEVKSPIKATVQKIHNNTIGGVIAPGGDVIDLVPLDDRLVVEAKISPKDIPFIKPGQHATIKFTAYDFTIYGGVSAEVNYISSDTITDEKDETYYLVHLVTEYDKLHKDLLVIPGMTVQADILTGKRTVLRYLLKPLFRAKSEAFSER